MKCKCTQYPDLRQTGFGPPEADLYCPVCGTVFWSGDNGVALQEPPAKWPTKKEVKKQTWKMKGGHWITA